MVARTCILDERTLAESSASDLRTQGTRLKEVLERGDRPHNYPANPWKNAAGIPLADFLATPMEQFRNALAACVKYCDRRGRRARSARAGLCRRCVPGGRGG